MLIKKGTRLSVKHQRKGKFLAIAERDFDTATEEFYPVAAAEGVVEGLSRFMEWTEGESIPCRSSLCEIEVVGEVKS